LLFFWINISLRYVIFTLPAYALLASYLLIEIFHKLQESTIDKELRIKALKNLQLNKILSIGVLLGLLCSIQNLPSLYYYYSYGEHPNWRAACLFVKSQMNPDDLIVSTVPDTVEYYLGRIDYQLSEETFEEIKNTENRVWLLIDDWRRDRIDPNHKIRDWLALNCELAYQEYLIKVYMFNPHNGKSIAVTSFFLLLQVCFLHNKNS